MNSTSSVLRHTVSRHTIRGVTVGLLVGALGFAAMWYSFFVMATIATYDLQNTHISAIESQSMHWPAAERINSAIWTVRADGEITHDELVSVHALWAESMPGAGFTREDAVFFAERYVAEMVPVPRFSIITWHTWVVALTLGLLAGIFSYISGWEREAIKRAWERAA